VNVAGHSRQETGVRLPSPPSGSTLGTYIIYADKTNNKSPDIRAFLLVSKETLTDVVSGLLIFSRFVKKLGKIETIAQPTGTGEQLDPWSD
jgi:hypothetical protein